MRAISDNSQMIDELSYNDVRAEVEREMRICEYH